MSRLPILALLGALTLALAPAGSALASAATPQSSTSENENPINDQGSSFHYRSEITFIAPDVRGLSIEVLEFADRLVARNHTGKTVTIYGYSGEPYARVQPNGTTEQNVRSPAVYLNTNFYGNVTVPPSAGASLPPKWVVVDRAGTFEWHDHRIHWMSPVTPPQVKDTSKRTKIFDWSVPIAVGAQKGVVDGQLFWVPDSSKAPVAAIVAIVLLAIAFVLFVRRRRKSPPHEHEAW
jgi:LPXTG-motif cell wall-anchored protein